MRKKNNLIKEIKNLKNDLSFKRAQLNFVNKQISKLKKFNPYEKQLFLSLRKKILVRLRRNFLTVKKLKIKKKKLRDFTLLKKIILVIVFFFWLICLCIGLFNVLMTSVTFFSFIISYIYIFLLYLLMDYIGFLFNKYLAIYLLNIRKNDLERLNKFQQKELEIYFKSLRKKNTESEQIVIYMIKNSIFSTAYSLKNIQHSINKYNSKIKSLKSRTYFSDFQQILTRFIIFFVVIPIILIALVLVLLSFYENFIL